jgi:anthranilate/para-aminobenzoate synthase component II
MQKPIRSVCYHHQAVALAEAPKEHIVPSVVSQSLSDPKEIKIVKASEPKTSGSSPMLLLQFHPEYYRSNNGMSKENEGFWDILGDSAKAYRTKRVTLEQFKRNVK